MLKAGEYSPNNPLIRGERSSGDALLGLGEYERRRNTLRKLRQQQYREYLDQQAKKKQEEKEQAERERREREQREREREEREREREIERLERDRVSPERPRAFINTVFSATQTFTSKVDTAVQTTTAGRPLSVAVQTDDAEFYRLSSPLKCPLTQAERELSPRTVAPERRSLPDLGQSLCRPERGTGAERYKPSLLDADAVQQRNAMAEKEAAAKRQYYQQELKNQILEQQRIREERKAREKLLEAAEMRRLEEQLRMLRGAQELELNKHAAQQHQMKENATDYEKKRTALQKEIDLEQHALIRARTHTHTSHSDGLPSKPSKIPFYCPAVHKNKEKKHFSTNIPDHSIFSPNYDVDTYLRKNLNPSKEMLSSRLDTSSSECLASKYLARYDRESRLTDRSDKAERRDKEDNRLSKKVVVEAIVHDRPKYEPKEIDNPIPVLRHSPVNVRTVQKNTDLSEAMQVVDDKWKVPVVQKNILKSLPNEEGKSVSILTQLGSIRRQLQLEQLKLDKMLTKDSA
ncbi:zinc finger CCCH domain-containing protein 13-like isoform X2 [Leguminivora glycinivorella]|nr:zinc finger CCCH domain-containing protein 13-like isoform X2 [Leguminivora glycinivorella]XP_048007090.1 zinc finger CCCH domain-containing protein 13-like isoform X2 [Leguminivora glycinivorella]